MLHVEEVIVVEGRYDRNTLSQIVDADIIETGGFALFNDRQKQKLIRTMAEKRGIVVLTDSDGAGFVIRSFIRSGVDKSRVKHAYIPEIAGKEKRKRKSSKEGMLGVEGMRPEILLEALRRAGVGLQEREGKKELITKADLFARGLTGGKNSERERAALIRALDFPSHLSCTALLEVLNALMTREEFMKLKWEAEEIECEKSE